MADQKATDTNSDTSSLGDGISRGGQPDMTHAVQSDVSEAAHQLTTICRRFESFFQMQIERLRHGLEKCREQKLESDVIRRMLADFDAQRKQWEAERDAEGIRLARASQDLADAWQSLEEQQRQLLIDPNLQQRKADRPAPKTAYLAVGHQEDVETSIFDFQQLQRQVREHAQRSR